MTEERNINGSPELSEQDAELLSTYIDNRLAVDDRANLEARLDADPFLRSELHAMQRTVAWLNQMPSRKAPRDFTLSPADVARQPKIIKLTPRRANPLWLSAAAAIVVIIFGGAIMLTVLGPQMGTTFEQVSSNLGADEMAGAPAADSESVEIAAQSTQISSFPTATPIPTQAAAPVQQQAAVVNEDAVEEAEAQEPPQESRDDDEQDVTGQDGLMDTTTTSQTDAGAQRSFPQPSPTFELFLGATEVIAPQGTPVAEIATEGDGASTAAGEAADFAAIPQTATAISQPLSTLESAPDTAAADDAVETSNAATLPPAATALSLPNTGGGAGRTRSFIGPQQATNQDKILLNTPAEIIRRALENIRNSILEAWGRG